jgi:hypothetical protein
MIRTFVLCLSLMGLLILLSSAVLSFLALEDEANAESEVIEAANSTATSLSEQGSRLLRPSRPILSGGGRQLTMAEVGTSELSSNVSLAIDEQVEGGLGAFIGSLAGDDRRRESIRSALVNAYADAARVSLATNSAGGMISDPNFIVNAMEEILDANELTQLDTFLEESWRESFEKTYSPQIDLISPRLEAHNKQLLLDTLFVETYAATSPAGNSTGSTNDFIAKQLDAIRLTRDSLRGAIQGAQFELINEFLNEQETGLSIALDVFSPVTIQ